MRNKKYFLSLLAIMTMFMTVQAQILTPVKWTKAIKWTDSHNGVITFTANIDHGWHMYSHD